MYIKYTFRNTTGKDLYLPFSYEDYLQAFLYHLNDTEFGSFLHDEGYQYNNRRYKLFTFSQILEKPKSVLRDRHIFVFPPEVNVIVASVENRMQDAMAAASFRDELFRLGKYEVEITGIGMMEPANSEDLLVKTESPICVYSTMLKADGKKYTKYWNPSEKEFAELVRTNAIHKYAAFYGQEPADQNLQVRPVGRWYERKCLYRNDLIIGYMGKFRLTGSSELIEIIQKAGMGSKNSAGKGLVVPIESYSSQSGETPTSNA